MIYNRAQFKKTRSPGEWSFILRNEKEDKCRCRWFIQTPSIRKNRWEWDEFEAWNKKTLTGECHNYLCDNFQGPDWWGFTRKKDIPFWLLKWL